MMSIDATISDPDDSTRKIVWTKWLVLALTAYYAAFALVVPVANSDSQVYNLARLVIAQAYGLFGNHAWSNERQILFPWSFDAIHYPFLFLRWGYGLPSFACFIGLEIIVYRLVAAARSAWQGWWCCLALLAMPTLMFQAVCTKNDFAVVFAVGCWYYAWMLWRAERRAAYLLFMALALSFAVGAKTTGLPFFGALGAWTLWQLRADRRAAGSFVACMIAGFVLLGSVEIYLNNLRLYHSPLGRLAFLAENKNRDGLAGGAANFIRYCFGNLNVGIDAANPTSPVAGWLENACRGFLRFVGLSGDLGYRSGLGEVDANMRFLKFGFDAGSDYGPVGALGLVASLTFCLSRPWSDPIWKLAATGVASLALTSGTVAWMMWNARFLLLPFSCFALALTLWLLRLPETGFHRFLRSAYYIVMVYAAFVYPLHSFNKKPADLMLALRHRPVYETFERPPMLEIIRDLHERMPMIGASPVLLFVGGDTWVLCILEIRGLHVFTTPVIDHQTLITTSREAYGGATARPVYILTVDRPVTPALIPELTLLRKYGETDSALYEWHSAQQPPSPER